MALPLLSPAVESSKAVKEKIQKVMTEFKVAMFCCGKRNPEELKNSHCIREIER
jgi:isopentenyl diphosphate isomerase/L-lactate dehydrogenase-like FMN-dependent dehydrogenase